MSNTSTRDYDIEKNGDANHLERLRTAGGHIADTSQPALPTVHRKLATPAPLGLLSFGTGMFLICMYGLHARGVPNSNMLVAVIVFFGGVCQFLAGIMEFIAGNTFGLTVFASYGAFNLSYAMIMLPGSGIVAAYTLPDGTLNPEFNQAVAIYLWAWFILTVIYTVGAIRSSWALFMTLASLDVVLLLLASGNMAGNTKVLLAGYGIGFVTTICSCESKPSIDLALPGR
jgi:succinate-acetate transporter protein